MANLQEWLNKFREGWTKKDIDAVLDLFSDDVEYYESQNKKLKNKEEIKEAWKEIAPQKNIKLRLRILAKNNKDKHKVRWELSFFNKRPYHYKGFYFISLNNESKCNYFLQEEN